VGCRPSQPDIDETGGRAGEFLVFLWKSSTCTFSDIMFLSLTFVALSLHFFSFFFPSKNNFQKGHFIVGVEPNPVERGD
jgi:hypothetical protein